MSHYLFSTDTMVLLHDETDSSHAFRSVLKYQFQVGYPPLHENSHIKATYILTVTLKYISIKPIKKNLKNYEQM